MEQQQKEKQFVINDNLRKGLIDYLNKMPNGEVMQGVIGLMNLPELPKTPSVGEGSMNRKLKAVKN